MKVKNETAIKFVAGYFVFAFVVASLVMFLLEYDSEKTWTSYAVPYLNENEEVISEIGTVEELEYVGENGKAEEDGRPVYFEVTTDKGRYYVILWMDQISTEPNEFEVSKHRIETEKPDFFR